MTLEDKQNELKELRKELKKLEMENPLGFAPAFSGACYEVQHNTAEDWIEYSKATKNPNPYLYNLPNSPLQILIDEATGYTAMLKVAVLKFALWYIEEFLKGFNGGK